MSAMINITDAASEYIQKQIKKEQGIAFRLSIKKTGCSGYSYLPQIVAKLNDSDTHVESKGIKILLDTSWLHLLQGVQVDYIEEEKSGLKQKKLVFINPNEASRCGCGESFHVG